MWSGVRRFCQRHFWELPEPLLDALRARLKPGMRTLEAGSGRSTRLFEEMGCEHVALEHDPRHAAPCRSVLLAPIKGAPPWYDWVPSHPFDLVLVDGPPGWIGRKGILRVLPDCMTERTVVVIDDMERPAERALAREISSRFRLSVSTSWHMELGVYPRAYAFLDPKPIGNP